MAPIKYLDEPDYPFAHIWRTIRKPVKCAICGQLIQKGERALEYLDETPLWQSGPREHKACALVRYAESAPKRE